MQRLAFNEQTGKRKTLSQKALVKELKIVAKRIAIYCKEFEIFSFKTHGWPIQQNSTYTQQRAKLTAYLYFLELLGETKFTEKILRERGFYMIDERAGIFAERLPYLKKEIYQEEVTWKIIWESCKNLWQHRNRKG